MSWGLTVIGLNGLMNTFKEAHEAMEPVSWTIGTLTEYAPHQEFGTSKMPPQKHLRPAVRMVMHDLDRYAAEAESVEDLIKTLALEIEKITKILAPVDTGKLMNSYTASPSVEFVRVAQDALAKAEAMS